MIILVANTVLNLHYVASAVSSLVYFFIATGCRYELGTSGAVTASFGFYSLGDLIAPIDQFPRILYFGF